MINMQLFIQIPFDLLGNSEAEVNLDFGELNFKPSTKDLCDAETHHMVLDAVSKSHHHNKVMRIYYYNYGK
jgi:hypothetical protein